MSLCCFSLAVLCALPLQQCQASWRQRVQLPGTAAERKRGMTEEGDVHGEGGEDETKAAVEESWAQLLMHTDGLQSVKALSPFHSSIFVHQVHTRPSAFPSSASLAVTGEPGGFAPPAPLKILIPGFSSSLSSPYALHLSSNQPTSRLAHSLTQLPARWRCEERGGAPAYWLGCLPFLLFWEGGVLFLLLSVILTLSLVTVLPPPLLSLLFECKRETEREGREGSAASVWSLQSVSSLQDCCYLPSCLAFSLHLCITAQGIWLCRRHPSSLSVLSFLFFLSGSAVKSIFACVWQQTSEDADTSGCLQLPQPRGLLILNTAGKRVILFAYLV